MINNGGGPTQYTKKETSAPYRSVLVLTNLESDLVCCFTSRWGVFRSHGKVTNAGEGPQWLAPPSNNIVALPNLNCRPPLLHILIFAGEGYNSVVSLLRCQKKFDALPFISADIHTALSYKFEYILSHFNFPCFKSSTLNQIMLKSLHTGIYIHVHI